MWNFYNCENKWNWSTLDSCLKVQWNDIKGEIMSICLNFSVMGSSVHMLQSWQCSSTQTYISSFLLSTLKYFQRYFNLSIFKTKCIIFVPNMFLQYLNWCHHYLIFSIRNYGSIFDFPFSLSFMSSLTTKSCQLLKWSSSQLSPFLYLCCPLVNLSSCSGDLPACLLPPPLSDLHIGSEMVFLKYKLAFHFPTWKLFICFLLSYSLGNGFFSQIYKVPLWSGHILKWLQSSLHSGPNTCPSFLIGKY
jgi:hypothetical protein